MRIYCLGTVRSDPKNIAVMKKDKDIKRSDIDFQYANNMVAVRWFDNRGVTMVGTCLEKSNKVSIPVPSSLRLSKITILVWVVLIFSIKKQLLTNWAASHM